MATAPPNSPSVADLPVAGSSVEERKAAALEDIEALESAMLDAGYAEATITIIQAMAAAIVVGGDFARTIKSQSAPSGAARSFDKTDKAVSALRRSLASLDTAGITAGLIGPDPSAQTLFMAV